MKKLLYCIILTAITIPLLADDLTRANEKAQKKEAKARVKEMAMSGIPDTVSLSVQEFYHENGTPYINSEQVSAYNNTDVKIHIYYNEEDDELCLCITDSTKSFTQTVYNKLAGSNDQSLFPSLDDLFAGYTDTNEPLFDWFDVTFLFANGKSITENLRLYATGNDAFQIQAIAFSNYHIYETSEDLKIQLLTSNIREITVLDSSVSFYALTSAPTIGNMRQMAANYRDPEYQYNLGVRCFNGDDCPVNKIKAVTWWQRSGEQGHAGSIYMLAYCLYTGQGVWQADANKAIELYYMASELGNPDAQYVMAIFYRDGYGVPIDKAKYESLIRLSAAAGCQAAQQELQKLQ